MHKNIVWVLLALVIAAGAFWYVNARQPVTGHPSVIETPAPPPPAAEQPKVEHPVETIQAANEPEDEAEVAPEPLPSLEDSDPEMTAALDTLFDTETVADRFITQEIINRFVATVDSLTSRQIAPLVLPVRAPSGKFLADEQDGVLAISPENAQRYAPYVDMVRQLDIESAVSMYKRYYPLIQQAYTSLGYPDAYFNDRLVEVIDQLLATPEVSEPPRLVKPEAVYLYEDEDLEALSAGQKLLLRIGPENRALVKSRLQALKQALTGGAQDG